MDDFFEIDFLDVESDKSGDAIAIRYGINGEEFIHVVDGGFQATGPSIVTHINTYYGNPAYIHRVVVSHPDGDHAGGLRTVLETFEVGELWMLRPWTYASEIVGRFDGLTSVDNLRSRLRRLYPNLAALEDISLEKGIPIKEPFQGASIGHFYVLAPSRARYLDLIVESDRTPESVESASKSVFAEFGTAVATAVAKVTTYIRSAWGEEVFSPESTSAENEMSVVQFADLCGHKILLTADAGREALTEAADFAPAVGLQLPGIDRFQVPHHGSRRNVSTEVLDRWLGERLPNQLLGMANFHAIISSAKADTNHPRKAVVRAMIHRGGSVVSTEGRTICSSHNAPPRLGWSSVIPDAYPQDQEE